MVVVFKLDGTEANGEPANEGGKSLGGGGRDNENGLSFLFFDIIYYVYSAYLANYIH